MRNFILIIMLVTFFACKKDDDSNAEKKYTAAEAVAEVKKHCPTSNLAWLQDLMTRMQEGELYGEILLYHDANVTIIQPKLPIDALACSLRDCSGEYYFKESTDVNMELTMKVCDKGKVIFSNL